MSKGSHHTLGEDLNGVHGGFYNQIEQVPPKAVPLDNCTSQLINADDTETQFVTRSVYRRRRKRLWGRFTRKFLAYFFVLALIAVPVALLAIKSLGPCSYNTILSFNRNDIVPFLTTGNSTQYQLRDDQNVTSFQVFLFGDSLINKPFMNLDLEGKMKTYLPQFSLDITNVASNGCKISNMRDRLEHIIEADPKPDAVLLYWDSDVSDVDESRMSSDEVNDLRSKYRSDLSYLLSELTSNITYVALAGPGILGIEEILFRCYMIYILLFHLYSY